METTTGRSWILPADWLGRGAIFILGQVQMATESETISLLRKFIGALSEKNKIRDGWMDGWSLVDFLDGVFFVCFLHDVPWFIFPLDTIRYGVGHCIRMFRFEGCEWSQG